MIALFLALQSPDVLLPELRPPLGEEVQAAERRSRRQMPIIVRTCRAAIRSADPDAYLRTFADANGLSSYGRVTLALHCRIYQQGVRDGAP